MTSAPGYGIDAYVFLARPSSFELLEQLRTEGHIRAVIRTVSGPHQVIVAVEAASIEELPGVHARLGVDTGRGDLTVIGIPVHPLNGVSRIFPLPYAVIAAAQVAHERETEWHEFYGGHSETVAVSSIFGHGAATHLIEVTGGNLRDVNAAVSRILSHDAVTPVESYVSGAAFISGAGPRS